MTKKDFLITDIINSLRYYYPNCKGYETHVYDKNNENNFYFAKETELICCWSKTQDPTAIPLTMPLLERIHENSFITDTFEDFCNQTCKTIKDYKKGDVN